MTVGGRRALPVPPAVLFPILLPITLLVLSTLAACTGEVQPDAKYTYKPVFLPVRLVVTPTETKIEGDRSLVTPIGTFSIGAKYSLPTQENVYVVIRNTKTGFDKIYSISATGDRLTAVVNGKTTIDVTHDRVTIDVSSGRLTRVAFQKAVRQQTVAAEPSWISTHRSMWDRGWQESWYKPFAMTRWAYDDSTVDKWYGLGFAWFVLRLGVAVALGIFDTVLTFFFLLGQVGYFFFGPTARNVLYGLAILAFLFLLWSGRILSRV